MNSFWNGFNKQANPAAESIMNAFGGSRSVAPPPPPPPPTPKAPSASNAGGFFSNAIAKFQGSRFK